jgi:hypothetical protein
VKADATDWPPPARPLIAAGAGEAVTALWSDPSGRVLIGAVRLAGRMRVGVISGNTVTLLPVTVNPAAPDLGSW